MQSNEALATLFRLSPQGSVPLGTLAPTETQPPAARHSRTFVPHTPQLVLSSPYASAPEHGPAGANYVPACDCATARTVNLHPDTALAGERLKEKKVGEVDDDVRIVPL